MMLGLPREMRRRSIFHCGAGYWVLDAGYWVLDAGYWVLDAGYWVLGAGCWVFGNMKYD